ncbi:DUF349 domain-containing protein [Kineosporia sp. R_H_3]|uniref:DUF349 domain-containing protein n=1 Tax=Kineosporia sp. R_H_3 TaxID=1961848 RepID=UPI0018EA027D|nr:DUF349 domain-containing protein [Kineosporia sp. R_H_3]
MSAEQWGRVDADGTVYVRTADGERPVGSYPGASPEEALAYFARKFDDLAAQISLLEQRIAAGHVSGPEAESGVSRLRDAVAQSNAVGDLAALVARLDALAPLAEAKKAEADKAKAEAKAKAAAERATLVEEAETLSAVDAERMPWKTTGDRLRVLFDEWKRLQKEARLDKHTEDELWKRFSHARTTFDRKRRQHFGALDEQRAQVKAAKEALVAEAEALSTSTDWGPTAGAYRTLMDRWKAAGRASKKDDDDLWVRFRAAQDAFFAARTAASSVVDAEFSANLEVKEALLVEAEALLPVTDLQAAKNALRGIQERWEAAGKVPRADIGRVEGRMRAVEQAVRDAEQDRWRRTNPEARARAEDAVTQLETTIAGLRTKLEKAQAAGDARKVTEHEQAIAAREEWLEQARKALEEYSG